MVTSALRFGGHHAPALVMLLMITAIGIRDIATTSQCVRYDTWYRYPRLCTVRISCPAPWLERNGKRAAPACGALWL